MAKAKKESVAKAWEKELLKERRRVEECIRAARKTLSEGLTAQAEEQIAGTDHLADCFNIDSHLANGTRLKSLIQLLGKIDEAIDRAKKGVYGICLACGESIPAGRLKACCATKRCIACKTKNRPTDPDIEKQLLISC